MARVAYGTLVTAFTGSIGSLTFHNNRSGSVCSIKSNPTINPSEKQTANRKIFHYVVSQWSLVEAERRVIWEALAAGEAFLNKWGNPSNLSAFQLFVTFNINRQILGLPINMDAPTLKPAYITTPAVITTNPDELSFTWPGDPTGDDLSIFVFMSCPVKSTYLNARTPLFLVQILTGPTASTYNILPQYISYFNLPADFLVSFLTTGILIKLKYVVNFSGRYLPFESHILSYPGSVPVP